jgi:hypothetical protein
MPIINVGEQDFDDVADAANDALHAGDKEKAHRLDKLARKINASLSTQRTRKRLGNPMRMPDEKPLRWQDVDTVLRP